LKKCNVDTSGCRDLESDTSGLVSSRTRRRGKSDRATDEELRSGVGECPDESGYGETVDAASDDDATVEGGEAELIGDDCRVEVDDVISVSCATS